MMMMIGFTTHLSPARHLANVTPTRCHPGSGGTIVELVVCVFLHVAYFIGSVFRQPIFSHIWPISVTLLLSDH